MQSAISLRRSWLGASSGALCLALGGCHSAFVQSTVVNHTGRNISLFEVDYPNASFGGGQLAQGGIFHYRFKILGDGPIKISWTDAEGHDHTAQGPNLTEGEEGTLVITLQPDVPRWEEHLSKRP